MIFSKTRNLSGPQFVPLQNGSREARQPQAVDPGGSDPIPSTQGSISLCRDELREGCQEAGWERLRRFPPCPFQEGKKGFVPQRPKVSLVHERGWGLAVFKSWGAETQRSGFSDSWGRGQHPSTSQSCQAKCGESVPCIHALEDGTQ